MFYRKNLSKKERKLRHIEKYEDALTKEDTPNIEKEEKDELEKIIHDEDFYTHKKVKKIKEATPQTQKNYIEPETFRTLIIKFYKTDKICNSLALYVKHLCERVSFAPNFINYSWKEEMVGDAIVKCIQALRSKKYNPELGNAFSYFSQIVYNAFINRIKIEQKEHHMIHKYGEEIYVDLINQQVLPAPSKDTKNFIDE